MSERKAVIKNADMSEEMQQDAVDCATQALEKYNIEKVSSIISLFAGVLIQFTNTCPSTKVKMCLSLSMSYCAIVKFVLPTNRYIRSTSTFTFHVGLYDSSKQASINQCAMEIISM